MEVPTPPINHKKNHHSALSYPSSPLFIINTWFHATRTFPPALRYLRNLNISKLHDAPLFDWKLHAGVRIKESIKAAREELIIMMYVGKSQSLSQRTVAAATFIKQIDSWIMELKSDNLRQNLFLLEAQVQKSIRTLDKTPTS